MTKSDVARLQRLERLFDAKLATHTNPIEIGVSDVEWLLRIAADSINVQAESSELKKVSCSYCGSEVGRVVVFNGVGLLDTGHAMARAYHGVCKCGAPFHWVMTDAMLSQLITNLRQLNDKIK